MLAAMDFPQLGDLPIHQVFPGHVERVGEMIHFLILVKSFVDMLFDRANLPVNRPRAFLKVDFFSSSLLASALDDSLPASLSCVFFERLEVTEAIVLESEANNFNITALHVEIVASISWLVRSQRHGVLVWPKH